MPRKTMKTTELIMWLVAVVKQVGDLPVYLQEDTEGNGYGTLDKQGSLSVVKEGNQKVVIIQPFEEHFDFEEIFKEEK